MSDIFRMPDLSAQNTPVTVGTAIAELVEHCHVTRKQILFRPVHTHPAFGEIVGQDPAPGTLLVPDHNIILDVNVWAANTNMRFACFQAEDVLDIESTLNDVQLRDWETEKSFLVHALAQLERHETMTHDELLVFYERSHVLEPLFREFCKREHYATSLCEAKRILSPHEWRMLCDDMRRSASYPVGPQECLYLLSKYLKGYSTQLRSSQQGDVITVVISLDRKPLPEDAMRVRWLVYLFCPLSLRVKHKLEQLVPPPPPPYVWDSLAALWIKPWGFTKTYLPKGLQIAIRYHRWLLGILAIFIIYHLYHLRPNSPVVPTPPSIEIRLVNEHCLPQDYYVDRTRVISSMAPGKTLTFTTTAGKHMVRSCIAESQNCGPEVSGELSPSKKQIISPDATCSQIRSSIELLINDYYCRVLNIPDIDTRIEEVRKVRPTLLNIDKLVREIERFGCPEIKKITLDSLAKAEAWVDVTGKNICESEVFFQVKIPLFKSGENWRFGPHFQYRSPPRRPPKTC